MIIFCCSLQAQNTIYFNFNTKKLTSDETGANEVTSLDKSQKYTIVAVNFNPFQYSATTKIAMTDNVKGIFEIFNGLFLKGELPTTPPAAAAVATDRVGFISLRDKYIAEYEKSIRLNNLVFSEDFDCNKIPAAMLSKSNDLLTAYFNFIKQTTTLRDADKLPAEIPSDEATILKMNRFNNKVLYFVNTLKCKVELARFEPKGTSINIEIKFVPREEKSDLDNVDYSNSIPIKSRVKVTFSTGIFASNNLKKEYYIDDSLANNFVLKEEGKGNLLPGVMALAHLNLATLPDFGLNLGAGIDMDKTPHVLLGISYKIGNSNIILNSGLDLAYLEMLTDKYEVNVNYTTKPEVSNKKQFVGGFWMGISYKL